MQPLTFKEMEYIVDSMSNEDLLVKQCITTVAQSKNTQVQNICRQFVSKHQGHYQTLLGVLQQHSSIAPTTEQDNTWIGMQKTNQPDQSFIQ